MVAKYCMVTCRLSDEQDTAFDEAIATYCAAKGIAVSKQAVLEFLVGEFCDGQGIEWPQKLDRRKREGSASRGHSRHVRRSEEGLALTSCRGEVARASLADATRSQQTRIAVAADGTARDSLQRPTREERAQTLHQPKRGHVRRQGAAAEPEREPKPRSRRRSCTQPDKTDLVDQALDEKRRRERN